MAWVLLIVTGVLAVLVGVLALPACAAWVPGWLRCSPSSDAPASSIDRSRTTLRRHSTGTTPSPPSSSSPGSASRSPRPSRCRRCPAPVFADLLLKETVVQTASLFHGLRRALSPETRNRIRFQMRQEVKRSRKQRRADLREARREWAARQRADGREAQGRRHELAPRSASAPARSACPAQRPAGLQKHEPRPLVRRRGRGRDLRDDPRPPCCRGADRRRAPGPAQRRSPWAARMFRDEVAEGTAEKETELRERFALAASWHQRS